MIRLFDEHIVRKQQELEGFWKFEREDGKLYSLPVPGCWEQHPELENYRGRGSFSKKVLIPEPCNVRLVFKGVSHTADVWFDDAFVAHHYNAFTPFAGTVRNVKPGEHIIRVEVDNSFGEHSALHTPNDYYTYGGITRPVALEQLGEAYIEVVHFRPWKEGESWRAEITAEVCSLSDREQELEISGRLGENVIPGQTLRLTPAEKQRVRWELEFSTVCEWNPENPMLYMLQLELGRQGVKEDDYRDRVGFRTVELAGRKLCINGKPVFLKGFNRHEDYGDIGCAIPPQLMAQDVELMRDMGANAVRTCHYPNDERFLDLCDERGILVWEENHARGFGLEAMQNPNFERQCADCIEEMIYNHYNHPSIVIWGILNECASETVEGREIYRKQYEQIRSLDVTRPTTSATCRHMRDICLDLPDIVSFNMYSGWYKDVPVKERHEEEMDWIGTSGGEGKPVIVSEFGAAALYGCRDRGHCKWSEERQADILRENFEVYRGDERLTGVFIWQFADCRVTEEGGWFATRARCHNNKGILDEYRRPKLAYDMVKQAYESWEQ